MNIGRYVKMYSDDLRLKNYSSNTIENYCSQIKLFLERFNTVATKPSEISEKQILRSVSILTCYVIIVFRIW